MPFADLLTAMEAAVLPDEEDPMMSPSEQPQSSRSAPVPHSQVAQRATAPNQQPPPHDAAERAAEQPESSRSASQSDGRAGRDATVPEAQAQQPPPPRSAEQADAMHGNVHANRSQAAYSTAPPAPAATSELLVRPFKSLLSTPEREARMVRSPGVPWRLHVHQIDPNHVWVDGIGAMLRVKPPQPGALSQPLAVVATQVDSQALAAPQQQEAAPAARRSLVRSVPNLSMMQDVPELWLTWQEGNGMEQAALKDLPAEQIRAQKQRYLEWSKAARALEGQAQEAGVTPVQMAITLDAARVSEGSFVASFLKALGSRWLAQQRAAANAELPVDEMQE